MQVVAVQVPDLTLVYVVIVALLALVVGLMVLGRFVTLAVLASLSGCPIGFLRIVGMRMRRVDVRDVVFSRIRLSKAGIDIGPDPVGVLEAHQRAGGHLDEVSSALILLKGVGVALSWTAVTATDLRGRDVLGAANAMLKARREGHSLSWEQVAAAAGMRATSGPGDSEYTRGETKDRSTQT
jgi:uncharacterized protein YqfA (UPF0365 family)